MPHHAFARCFSLCGEGKKDASFTSVQVDERLMLLLGLHFCKYDHPPALWTHETKVLAGMSVNRNGPQVREVWQLQLWLLQGF